MSPCCHGYMENTDETMSEKRGQAGLVHVKGVLDAFLPDLLPQQPEQQPLRTGQNF